MRWDYTKLKIKIIEMNLTQTEFREKIGFSSTVLAKINHGEKIDMSILWKMCQFFCCDIGDIVSFKSVEVAK